MLLLLILFWKHAMLPACRCPNASALQSHADEMLPLIDAHVADIYPDRLGQGQQVAAGVALVRNDLRSATSQLTDKVCINDCVRQTWHC